MKVLGIDTSCDDTAAAVTTDLFEILSSVVASQDEHLRFGGVVPEVASRAHVRTLVPVIRTALDRAGVRLGDLDGVAVTHGPGLLGSLLVGVSLAKSLAYGARLPLIGVNHLEGHLWSGLTVDATLLSKPFLGLIVSGGHSEVVLVKRFGDYEMLGGTRDDAAGEAFDKVGKLLGVGYPGGPAIERLARHAREASQPAATKPLSFPVARAGRFDLSFSGVKTAVRYHVERQPPRDEEERAEIARAFEDAVVDALVGVVERALDAYPVEHLVLCGGVARNDRLAFCLDAALRARQVTMVRPTADLCTDNGAMIGFVGSMHLKSGKRSPLTLGARASLAELGWNRPSRTSGTTSTTALPLVGGDRPVGGSASRSPVAVPRR